MAGLPILHNPLIHHVDERTRGWVHSWETSAGQDGPGWRLVIYLSGCLLRCLYCHNPDTWNQYSGKEMSVDELWAEVERYLPMLKRGGITFTGGEPLVQAPFLKTLLRRAKEQGLHTAVDTSGFLGDRVDDEMMQDIDLVLLDIKCWNPQKYLRLTGKELEPTLRFARRLDRSRSTCLASLCARSRMDGCSRRDRGRRAIRAFAGQRGASRRAAVSPTGEVEVGGPRPALRARDCPRSHKRADRSSYRRVSKPRAERLLKADRTI